MSDPVNPMSSIKEWQRYYKKHQPVAEMDEPLVTKDSRENLHDTSKATDTLPNWREHYAELIGDNIPIENNDEYKQKATEHFADTIAEFFNEMTGEELFGCFYNAAKDYMEYVQKEYDTIKDLIDILEIKNRGKK